MQPATATPSSSTPPKKSRKLLKGVLWAAFAVAAVGHFSSDYRESRQTAGYEEIIRLQDALIQEQGKLINAQQQELEILKEGGGEAGGNCDDGFVIPDLKQRGPIQAKAVKPAARADVKTI